MKSINKKLLALIDLLTILGQSLMLSNGNAPEASQDFKEEEVEVTVVKVEVRSPKDRTMDMLRDFLDLAKHPQKKWHDWIDEIHKELKDIAEYTKFCSMLTKLKGENNAVKVGMALKEHKSLLPDDIRISIENMNLSQLLSILKTRIKK